MVSGTYFISHMITVTALSHLAGDLVRINLYTELTSGSNMGGLLSQLSGQYKRQYVMCSFYWLVTYLYIHLKV